MATEPMPDVEPDRNPPEPDYEMLAFPRGKAAHEKGEAPQEGMTLLDYFAGQIMVGLVTRSQVQVSHIPTAQMLATDAYFLADAMLRERANWMVDKWGGNMLPSH